MRSRSDANPAVQGLRERKKAKTKAAIQQHAVRLFREQGFAATTVEQIAEAAEVSPSTVFRYFPTKEDLVTTDDLDPVLIAAFEAQPPELSLMQAWRATFRSVFAELSSAEWPASGSGRCSSCRSPSCGVHPRTTSSAPSTWWPS